MKQFCAQTEHEYQTHNEAVYNYLGMASSSRTLLYCRKCGHHFYVKKSPQQYVPSNTTWTYTVPFSTSYHIYSGTTNPTIAVPNDYS